MNRGMVIVILAALPLIVGWRAPEDSCGFVYKPLHPEPVALVKEFLARNFNGQFTQAEPWLDGGTMCAGHLPGWDYCVVVAGYTMGAPRIGKHSAIVPITYQTLGIAYSDGSLKQVKAHERFDVVVQKTPYGWRIDNGEYVEPRVSIRWILTQTRWPRQTRKTLADWVRGM